MKSISIGEAYARAMATLAKHEREHTKYVQEMLNEN